MAEKEPDNTGERLRGKALQWIFAAVQSAGRIGVADQKPFAFGRPFG
jgi:hypothetical protein